jgi:hypothetical protein
MVRQASYLKDTTLVSPLQPCDLGKYNGGKDGNYGYWKELALLHTSVDVMMEPVFSSE